MEFVFSSSSTINCLIIVASVQGEDNVRYEDFKASIWPILYAEDVRLFEFSPRSRNDMIEALHNIESMVEIGALPIIQFFMHGQSEGLICADRSLFLWEDVHRYLRRANFLTKNNLMVISTACYGIELARRLSPHESVPFYILIAPQKEVEQAYVEERLKYFYLDIFRGSELFDSIERNLSEQFRIIHSEQFLFILLARYFRESCIGKAAIERRERLISQAKQIGTIKDRSDMKSFRAQLKSQIKPNAHVLQKYVSTFLLGKSVSFSYSEIEMLARSSKTMKDVESIAEQKIRAVLKKKSR